VRDARRRLAELFGLEPLAEESEILQMVAAPLPPCDRQEVKRRLYEEHRIEIPVYEWDGRPLIRASVQGYNDERDLDALLAALELLFS
jgi:isopenicillin-N epimerase